MFNILDRLRDMRIERLQERIDSLEIQVQTLSALLPMVPEEPVKTQEQIDWDRLLSDVLHNSAL